MGYYPRPLPPERGPRRKPPGVGPYGGGGQGFNGGGATGGWDAPPGREFMPPSDRRPSVPRPSIPNPAGGRPTSGWTLQSDCNPNYPGCLTGAPVQQSVRYVTAAGKVSPTCITGSDGHLHSEVISSFAVPNGHCTIITEKVQHCSGPSSRQSQWKWYHRDGVCSHADEVVPAINPWMPAPPLYVPAFAPAPDPNWLRGAPALPPFLPPPIPPVLGPGNVPWAKSFGRGGPRPAKPAGKQPPKKNRREPPKRMSRAARFGVAFFKVLDEISESAEIVDAFFDSLPDDVKKRWSKGRVNRSFLDNAGQYGIDGADWKLQALWENYGKIDVNKAIKNIIKNHIEDKIIGTYSRHLPRNTVNSLNFLDASGQRMSHEAIVAMQLKKVFAALGLE